MFSDTSTTQWCVCSQSERRCIMLQTKVISMLQSCCWMLALTNIWKIRF